MLPLGHTQQEYSHICFDYSNVTNPGCHESDATGGFVYIQEWAPVGPAGWQLACDIARSSDSKPGRKPWFATLPPPLKKCAFPHAQESVQPENTWTKEQWLTEQHISWKQ